MASSTHDPESYNRIFILGAKNFSEDQLHEAFEKFGVVKDVYFVKDRFTEERKGRLCLTITLLNLNLKLINQPVSYTHLTLPTNREV